MNSACDSYSLFDQEHVSLTVAESSDAIQDESVPLVQERLGAIDWDFPLRVAHSAIEGLHPYPAKFIAEIPGALLDALPLPTGTAVLDPFCGSGTTLVECQRRGISSYGVDLNPIACLMSRVKTMPLEAGLEDSISLVLLKAKRASNPKIPQISNLNHWFMPHVQSALAALTQSIPFAPKAHSDILRLALSSIIVRVSNQDSDTRYAAIAKKVTTEAVFSNFARAAHRIGEALSSRDYSLSPVNVLEHDVLSVSADEISQPIGLLITSPPYPNAYEYWLYHKYRMWWLGFDPIAVKTREIGARAHFFKTNRHTADDFSRQTAKLFELLRKVIVPGGFACFVVGRSRIHGKIVDNAQVIEDVAGAAGFHRLFSTERVLSPNRKSFNLSHANIKTETVLVLQNGE